MDEENHSTTPYGPEELVLSRNLGLLTITMIGIGGMIGAGIFVLTGIAAGLAGPALLLVFFLNGIITLFTAMVYAELGSAFPEAGGGYLWVKKGLGKTQGFLAGWMSWFAHIVAGSFYSLGFGRFTAELLLMSGFPTFGLPEEQIVRILTLMMTTSAIILFTTVNYLGSSETGTAGNIVTFTKILILSLLVLFGILAMTHVENWSTRFTSDFMPYGFGGVLSAMGLTFIAFEGYEIIAQSGEEAVNPKRNIPRAIFLSIFIVVIIYILVAIVAIAAIQSPAGIPIYVYLGQKKELAIVEIANQTFPFGIGALVILFSGIVSTMSALNATTYSSSRVSFAMGRDRNLPDHFARIHSRRHTPYWAVIISGGLMLLIAVSLPIEHVAAAADIMFLLLFTQVNLAVITLRRRMPNWDRGYKMHWYPITPIIGLITKGVLAIYLFTYSPQAWYVTIAWLGIGLLIYFFFFSENKTLKKFRRF